MSTTVAPTWWSVKGYKMALEPSDNTKVTITSPMAQVTITPALYRDDLWSVNWHIDHGTGHDAGHRNFTTAALKAAFNIASEYISLEGISICERYDRATSAEPNLFIRLSNYLCFPGPISAAAVPYTGEASGPWVSLLITDDILNAVEAMIVHRSAAMVTSS